MDTPILNVHHDTRHFISAPNTVWQVSHGSVKELFNRYEVSAENRNWGQRGLLSFSPNDSLIGIVYTHSIHVLNLVTGDHWYEEATSERRFEDAWAKWSPSGDYLAYLTNNYWESRSALGVFDKDHQFRCLVDPYEFPGQQRVKNFAWHPQRDLVFFILGYAYGTLSIGGSIYGVDMSGETKLLIAHDRSKSQEIAWNIQAERDTLKYRIGQFTPDWNGPVEYFERAISFDSLQALYQSK